MEQNRRRKKEKSTEYLAFYKYYYDRLSADHPRWNSSQITTIIKLLWKKKRKAGRTKTKGIRKTSNKVLSGWQFYRKKKESEGYTRTMIKVMWKGLPIESKRYFKIQGLGRELMKKKTSGSGIRKMLNRGSARTSDFETASDVSQSDYSWMRHQIN